MKNNHDNLELKALLHTSGEVRLTPEEVEQAKDWLEAVAELSRRSHQTAAIYAPPPPSANAAIGALAAARRTARRRNAILVPLAAAATLALLFSGTLWQQRKNTDTPLHHLSSVLFLLNHDTTGEHPACQPAEASLEALSEELWALQYGYPTLPEW